MVRLFAFLDLGGICAVQEGRIIREKALLGVLWLVSDLDLGFPSFRMGSIQTEADRIQVGMIRRRRLVQPVMLDDPGLEVGIRHLAEGRRAVAVIDRFRVLEPAGRLGAHS